MENGHRSIADRIKALDDITSEIVEVPEWKEVLGDAARLEVRSMTGRERAQMLQRAVDVETGVVNLEAMYPEIVIATVFDPETGERIFGADALEWLNTKNSRALERLALTGSRLSGLDEKAKERNAQSFPGGEDGA